MPPTPRSVKATRVKDTASSDVFEYPGPEELNEPPASFDAYARCIFGHKAAGKTTLCAGFPDSLTLMFEPVRKGLRIRMIGEQQGLKKVTAEQIRNGETDVWEKVVTSTQAWLDDPTIKTLNFDSIDIFYECCYASVCARNNVNKPGDSKNGPDIWNEIKDEFASYFSALRETDMGINMLSHVKGREQTELDGSKLKGIWSPSCAPACLQFIRQAVDFIFFLGSHNGKRACLVRDPTAMSLAAVSPENVFMQPDGKEISIIEMPHFQERPNAGYLRLVDGFNNRLWDIDTPEDQRIIKKAAPPLPPRSTGAGRPALPKRPT